MTLSPESSLWSVVWEHVAQTPNSSGRAGETNAFALLRRALRGSSDGRILDLEHQYVVTPFRTNRYNLRYHIASGGEWNVLRGFVREIIETVILALFMFLALQFSLQNFRVEGVSMFPTLEAGQYVLVNKLVYAHFPDSPFSRAIPFVKSGPDGGAYLFHPPNRGDVIVFVAPPDTARDFVKRVIGVPGDTVRIVNGDVFVNGERLEEPYLRRKDSYSMAPRVVPEGSFFVLGDNRAASDDSRKWGFVPAENIIGMAWLSYWPPAEWQVLQSFRWLFQD